MTIFVIDAAEKEGITPPETALRTDPLIANNRRGAVPPIVIVTVIAVAN